MQVLSDPAYERLKDQLIAATGLAFYADRNELLAGAIGARLSYLELPGCASYASFLADGRRGRDEMDALTAQLTIGETYFFRDEEFYAALREIVFPDILERKQSLKRLRIWSAGCATGAEPYSVAILLMDEMAAQVAGWQVEIYATDMNKGCLARAAEGKFRPAALRSTSEMVKHACFSNDGRTWTIHSRYKRWVSFHHMNLVENGFSTAFTGGSRFDLILCRNVMIYFAPEVIHRLIGRFHESLEDWGWLVVGSSEYGLDNYKAYRTVNAPGARLYQKAPISQRRLGAAPEPPPAAHRPAAGPLTQPQALPRLPVWQCPEDMDGLRALADRGEWQGAAEYGQRLLAQDGLNPAVHFYRALIFDNLGIADEPERSLRQAIYLDRNFALAHYHLGVALKKHGETRAAARSFRNVLKVLAGAADQTLVAGGPGVTVTALKELARMHMAGSSGA